MPRGKIELVNKVESLSILDVEGNADSALDPKLEPQELHKLLRGLLLARRYDERMLKLQRQGRIGTYGPALGQEAASLGPAYVLAKTDWLVPSFREPAAMIYRGWPIEKLVLWWGGNEEGAQTPKDIRDLPICVPVASQCLYGAGIAWGCKLKKEGTAVLCFVGDGGTSEGDFHEAMNVAGAFKLPMVTVIQNNQWAISLPRCKQSACATLAQKCIAYGFNGIQVDGNDILAMIVAAGGEAVARGPERRRADLIEAVTYRLGVHTTADDPKKYRTEEEVEQWKVRDPLSRFYKYLKKRQIMDDKARDLLEEEITGQINEAIEKAEQFEPNVIEPFHHCFATMPNHLEAQFAEFQAYMNLVSNGEGNSENQDSQVYRSVH